MPQIPENDAAETRSDAQQLPDGAMLKAADENRPRPFLKALL